MGEVRAFPYGRCAKVTRAEVAAQRESQEQRACWWWLAERLAEVFVRSQPGWLWEARSVRVEVFGEQGEEVEAQGGGYVQALSAGVERLALVVGWEPALGAALLGLWGSQQEQPPLRAHFGVLEQARLDGLMVDVLAWVEARLPQDQGLRLVQSGAQRQVLLRALGVKGPLVCARIGFAFCPPEAQAWGLGYVNLWARREWLKTPWGKALTGAAAQGLSQGLWSEQRLMLRLVFGVGDLALEDLAGLSVGDVLCVVGGAGRFCASGLWGFAPCWLGWEGLGAQAWWEASLVIRGRGFGLILSKQGPEIMTKETLPQPALTDSAPAAAMEGFIRGAPVEVVFELGRLVLSAEQLALAGAGDVIELGRALGAPIQVRVGERLVGEGELVDIEGQLGVRLLRIGP